MSENQLNPLLSTLRQETFTKKIQAWVPGLFKDFLIHRYGNQADGIRHLIAEKLHADNLLSQSIHAIHPPKGLTDELALKLWYLAQEAAFAIRVATGDDGRITGYEKIAVAGPFARGADLAVNGGGQ